MSNLAEMMFEYAGRLTHANEGSAHLPLREVLNRRKLDFTVASLSHLDDYLETIRKKGVRELQQDAAFALGAYLGEVVRRNSPSSLQWRASGEEGEAFLMTPTGVQLSPFGKPLKFIENGRSESLERFAKVALELSAKNVSPL